MTEQLFLIPRLPSLTSKSPHARITAPQWRHHDVALPLPFWTIDILQISCTGGAFGADSQTEQRSVPQLSLLDLRTT